MAALVDGLLAATVDRALLGPSPAPKRARGASGRAPGHGGDAPGSAKAQVREGRGRRGAVATARPPTCTRLLD